MSVRSLRRALATTPSASVSRLGERFLDEHVLAGVERAACQCGVGGHRCGKRDRVHAGAASTSSSDAVVRAEGKDWRARASCSSEPSQIQVSSESCRAPKLRARFGPQ